MNESDIVILDRIISERENHFQHALSEAVDSHLLYHLKCDLDFLKEKRREILEKTELLQHVRR